jgi:hypothetical protein
MGCGVGYLKPGSVIENFAGFGYNTPGDLLPNPVFQIVLSRAGSITTFKQPTWNIDPADGTGALPSMSTWDMKNSFEISATESRILFKILSPQDGLYYPVHQILATNNNQLSLLQDFSLSFMSYVEYPTNTTQVGVNDNFVAVSSFMMGIQNGFTSTYDRFSAGFTTPAVINGAGLETPIFGIIHNGTLFSAPVQLCYTNVNVDWISFGCTISTVFKVYRNAVFAGMVFTPGFPADNLNLIPVTECDRTFVMPNGPPTTPGIVILTLNVGSGQTLFLDMTKYNIWLDTDDSITVSAFSAGAATCVVAFGYSAGFTHQ